MQFLYFDNRHIAKLGSLNYSTDAVRKVHIRNDKKQSPARSVIRELVWARDDAYFLSVRTNKIAVDIHADSIIGIKDAFDGL